MVLCFTLGRDTEPDPRDVPVPGTTCTRHDDHIPPGSADLEPLTGDVGVITVEGESGRRFTIDVASQRDQSGCRWLDSRTLHFRRGETLRVTGTGGDLAAPFAANLVVPNVITPSADYATWHRGHPFDISWTPTIAESVEIDIAGNRFWTSDMALSATCTTSGADEAFRIPPEVTQDHSTTPEIALSVASRVRVEPGDHGIVELRVATWDRVAGR